MLQHRFDLVRAVIVLVYASLALYSLLCMGIVESLCLTVFAFAYGKFYLQLFYTAMEGTKPFFDSFILFAPSPCLAFIIVSDPKEIWSWAVYCIVGLVTASLLLGYAAGRIHNQIIRDRSNPFAKHSMRIILLGGLMSSLVLLFGLWFQGSNGAKTALTYYLAMLSLLNVGSRLAQSRH